MKDEVNPIVMWSIIGVLVIGLVAFFVLRGGGGYKADTGGTDEVMQRVQETGTFYQPPPGAPVPNAGGPPGMGGPPMGFPGQGR